jgi:hypothetical protein
MVERREQVRFAREAGQPLRIAREEQWQNLDRDVAGQPAIARTVDFSHTTGADDGDDFVRAETSAGRQAHNKCMRL